MVNFLSTRGFKTALNPTSPSLNVGAFPEDPYITNNNNWHKALPYGFVFFNRTASTDNISKASSIIYLPILPNNIQVTTHFATNVVTTLYGVVEEHSEVRYYDINISGTTGFAPRFVGGTDQLGEFGAKFDETRKASNNNQEVGRSAFSSTSLSDSFGGFLPEISNSIEQVLGAASDIQGFLGEGERPSTGVTPDQSGYAAFHKFYKFLLKYKKDAAGDALTSKIRRKTHPMQFLNYKDAIKYDCIPLTFNLERTAESPMLYNYTIQLRCYNLRNVNVRDRPEFDQLSKLGLGSVTGQSLFSSLSGAAGSAATLVSTIL